MIWQLNCKVIILIVIHWRLMSTNGNDNEDPDNEGDNEDHDSDLEEQEGRSGRIRS